MLYTPAEYQAFQKVRAVLSGQRRYGWVSITARVHPDDAGKVRALLAELESARTLELLTAVERDETRAAAQRVKLNDHARAVVAMMKASGGAHMREIRALIQSRVTNKSTARSALARTLDRLIRVGLVKKTNKDYFALNDRQADSPTDSQAQPDCDA